MLDDDSDWRREGVDAEYRVDFFDAIFIRKDPPFDGEYLYLTHIMERAEQAGVIVVNAPRALRDFSEKLSVFRFARHIPPTLIARDINALIAFHRAHGGAVVKPLDGMGGRGVFYAKAGDKNLRAILETLGEHGRRTLLVQKYLPEIASGDMRVVVIGGKPAPFMLARIARADDNRANLDAGGEARAMPLGEAERTVAEDIGPALAAAGVVLAGLDMIGGKLTEINVTSPTCLREILDQTGCDCAKMVLQELRRAKAAA
jgi:glutathione synthase